MIATVIAIRSVDTSLHSTAITLALPNGTDARNPAGRFFLARCEDGNASTRAWESLLRRPLFPIHVEPRGAQTHWTFHLPTGSDASYQWLANRQPGDEIDLLGPLGTGFVMPQRSGALLLIADAQRAPLLFPLMHAMLDRGGRVSLLLKSAAHEGTDTAERLTSLLGALPFAVEARVTTAIDFDGALVELTRWADQLCLALPFCDYAQIAQAVRVVRFRLREGIAQALVLDNPAHSLPCGIGACLACLVPLANGSFTRACVHGPVFDLTRIA